MYDAREALNNIDLHATRVMIFFMIAAGLSFVYFLLAFRISIKEKVYVVPFVGAALFFWHDSSFVFQRDLWFHVYNHWWLKLWWNALVGTSLLEAVMIWQVYRYGRQESLPGLSQGAWGGLIILGTLGIGAIWYFIKVTLHDDLYFVTFIITAVFSIPFHTGLMIHRRSSKGQSVIMQAVTIVIMWCLGGVFMPTSPFFTSPPSLIFFAVFTIWPLVNIALIVSLRRAEGQRSTVLGQVAGYAAQ